LEKTRFFRKFVCFFLEFPRSTNWQKINKKVDKKVMDIAYW